MTMDRRNLLVIPAALAASSCVSSRKKGARNIPDGTLQVYPEWTPGSQKQYLLWINSKDTKKNENVRHFRAKMAKIVQDGLGSTFPRVKIPKGLDPDIALAGGSQSDPFLDREVPEEYTRDQSPGPVEKFEYLLEDAVHDAVKSAKTNLKVAGFKPFRREVIYVIEDGVVHCIYNTFVVEVPYGSDPRWWMASHSDGHEKVAAYLNLTTTVGRIY